VECSARSCRKISPLCTLVAGLTLYSEDTQVARWDFHASDIVPYHALRMIHFRYLAERFVHTLGWGDAWNDTYTGLITYLLEVGLLLGRMLFTDENKINLKERWNNPQEYRCNQLEYQIALLSSRVLYICYISCNKQRVNA
jgi:hypothetical protein